MVKGFPLLFSEGGALRSMGRLCDVNRIQNEKEKEKEKKKKRRGKGEKRKIHALDIFNSKCFTDSLLSVICTNCCIGKAKLLQQD